MSDTLWQRLAHGGRRLLQRPDWTLFAGEDWPDRIMAADVTDRFHAKQGRSTGRWVLEADGRRLAVYLKRLSAALVARLVGGALARKWLVAGAAGVAAP